MYQIKNVTFHSEAELLEVIQEEKVSLEGMSGKS
jgi:hypothetical protein